MNLWNRLENLNPDHIPNLDARGFCIPGSRHPEKRSTDTPEIVDITDKRQRQSARRRLDVQRCIAILDFETDPFDNVTRADISPFLCVLYSDQFEPRIIWENDNNQFVDQVCSTIRSLPGRYTIYAHNGGKFDYMFLIRRLSGVVTFKGRGVMSARLGEHQLRDSFHIIPERLANWKKDVFDYNKLRHDNRERFREDIIRYCINDCKYLLEIIRRFVKDNGVCLSIGQASLRKLKQEQGMNYFECIGENTDGMLRGVNTDASDREGYNQSNDKGYFYGGRVECIAGAGRFIGRYKLYDVNSMYPFVMAYFQHPIGASYSIRHGEPTDQTAFVTLECVNHGALITKGEDGETTGDKKHGIFHTTIHEYNAARDLGLIGRVKVLHSIDCNKFGTFERFVLPIYNERQQTKARLADLLKQGVNSGTMWDNIKLTDTFLKLYLNNAYGKFAQNPRKFRENYIQLFGEKLPEGFLDKYEEIFRRMDNEHPSNSYVLWQSRGPRWNERLLSYDSMGYRFYNIGTGASITGAARSVLLYSIHASEGPIYCDTDSLICKSLSNVNISNTDLGAWKLEKEFDEVIIVGKKQYAARLAGAKVNSRTGLPTREKDYIVRNKGVADVTYAEMLSLLNDKIVTKVAKAPTLTKFGNQFYMERRIRRTAPLNKSLLGEHRYGIAI